MGEDRVPLVTTYHPALSSMMRVVQKLHPMLKSSEEHRKVFLGPSFMAFRRCKNLKDILIKSKLYSVDNGVCDAVLVGSFDVKFAKSCVVLQHLFPGLLLRNIGLIFRLILTRLTWYVCWNVVLVVYNMLAVHVLRSELGLTITSQVIAGLTGVLQGVPKADIFRYSAQEGHRGFLEEVRVVILGKLYGNGGNGKASGSISWIPSFPKVLISGR